MSGVIKKSITLLTAIIPDEEKRNGVQLKLAESLTFLFKQCIDCFQVLLNMVSSKNNETKKFRLGLTLMQLGLSLRDNLLVHKNALPIMEKLVKKTKKSVYLTVPEGDEGVLIDRVDADLLFKISEPIVDENTVMHR